MQSELKTNPKEYVYTRDFLIQLYSPDYPLPPDVDTTLSAFATETRPPLANLPLSDLEKRLLSMVSINSDGNRRNNFKKREKVAPVGTKKEKDDLWDMPNNTSGNFEGVFGFGTPSPLPFAETRSASTKNAWSVLEQEGNSSPPKPATDSSFLGFSSPQGNLRDPLFGGMLPKTDMNPGLNLPPFKFNPPQWLYEDPSGRVQGPFSSEQMHGWYKEGYFPPALPIKCVGDPQFISLVLFVEKYGSSQPFLDSLRDQEALEREYYYQAVARQQMGFRNPLGVDPQRMGIPMFVDLNPMDAGIRPFGASQIRFKNNPSPTQPFPSRVDQQGLYQFMSQHQYEDPKPQPVAEVPKAPSPIPREPSPESRLRTGSPSPTFHKSPPRSPAKEEVISEPEPVSVKKEDKKKKKKEKKAEQPAVQPDPEAVIETKPEVKPAPWANVKKTESALKAIQEAEQREAENRRKIEEKLAQERILAEAQFLAQKESAANASGVPTTSQWASSSGSKQKKTLAEIMEDEEKERKEQEKRNPQLNAPKAYANTVAGNVGPSKPINFAKIAANPAAPKEEDGWNVVKKPQKPVVPQAAPVIKTAPKLNYSSASSQATNADGQSPSQLSKPKVSSQTLQWSRSSLRNVARDSSLNIDEFISILLSLDIKETATITMICDDALGGSTSIDSRKFADEFIKRRHADQQGIAYSSPVTESPQKASSATKQDDNGWTSVGGGSPRPTPAPQTTTTIASENKFVVVGKSGKKKKGKK